jgi:NAD(P)H-hydrate repair Nnr-like enzyme with NAD(P)H-hydrate epimerase domain
MTVGSGSDGGDGFFFNSTAWARQRRADAMVVGLGEIKLKPRGTKHDEV